MKPYLLICTAAITLLLTTVFPSCQKVIDIDLNEKEPKIVIEGGISDQPGPHVIRISQTVNFDESNEFPPVTGAYLILRDDAGNSETLNETAPGEYVASSLQGIPGRTYTLEATVNGATYTSVSYLPAAVPIDSLTIEESFWGIRQVNIYLKDPAETENYYRIVQEKNRKMVKDILVMSDELQNGSHLSTPLFINNIEDSLRRGDTIMVQLQSIDRAAYDYFRTLMMLTTQAGPPSDAPANPITGFSNGALGYFSAYAVRAEMIVVP